MNKDRLFYLTEQGLENIKKEYTALKDAKRAKIKEGIPHLLKSEELNSEYFSFKEDLIFLEMRIAEIENILKRVQLIKHFKKKQNNVVDLGSRVIVEINGRGKDEFKIVGTFEANPSLGRISNESPVGKALWGRKLGDKVVVYSPVKTVYIIKKINY